MKRYVYGFGSNFRLLYVGIGRGKTGVCRSNARKWNPVVAPFPGRLPLC